MVKFNRHNLSNYGGIMSFVGMVIYAHYLLFVQICKVENKKQLNYIHYLVVFIIFIEIYCIIYAFNAHLLSTLFYAIIVEITFFLGYFSAVPRWVDDDKAEEPSKSSFQQNIEDLDAMLKPAVDKEIQNIQAADDIAKQSGKNTGGKNTEITMNVSKGLDLKNNTISLHQKPRQSNQNNEQ